MATTSPSLPVHLTAIPLKRKTHWGIFYGASMGDKAQVALKIHPGESESAGEDGSTQQ